jgi:hypothetical protein
MLSGLKKDKPIGNQSGTDIPNGALAHSFQCKSRAVSPSESSHTGIEQRKHLSLLSFELSSSETLGFKTTGHSQYSTTMFKTA